MQTSTEPPVAGLRRRTHTLERGSSEPLSPTTVASSKLGEVDDEDEGFATMTSSQSHPAHSPSTSSFDDIDSASSEELGMRQEGDTSPPPLGRRSSSRSARPALHVEVDVDTTKRGPMSPASRAWYDFDLAVVVALVSPVGNWLTGGDHIKNLLLMLLLIFYLHQIVEIPWNLYQSARPRQRSSHHGQQLSTESARVAALATSELQSLEIIFFGLSVVSPLIGALVLRAVTRAFAGADVISWFSTTLFVLATGIRPWRHLVQRLEGRTAELHDAMHYPRDPKGAESEKEKDRQRIIDDLLARVERLERETDKTNDELESSFDYVDDAVEVVEKTVKRWEKKWEKMEVKMTGVDEAVEGLKKAHKGKERERLTVETHLSSWHRIPAHLPAWVSALWDTRWDTPSHSPARSHTITSPTSGKTSFRMNSPRLETIQEEGQASTSYAHHPRPQPPPYAYSYTWVPGLALLMNCAALLTYPLRAFIGLVFKLTGL